MEGSLDWGFLGRGRCGWVGGLGVRLCGGLGVWRADGCIEGEKGGICEKMKGVKDVICPMCVLI